MDGVVGIEIEKKRNQPNKPKKKKIIKEIDVGHLLTRADAVDDGRRSSASVRLGRMQHRRRRWVQSGSHTEMLTKGITNMALGTNGSLTTTTSSTTTEVKTNETQKENETKTKKKGKIHASVDDGISFGRIVHLLFLIFPHRFGNREKCWMLRLELILHRGDMMEGGEGGEGGRRAERNGGRYFFRSSIRFSLKIFLFVCSEIFIYHLISFLFFLFFFSFLFFFFFLEKKIWSFVSLSSRRRIEGEMDSTKRTCAVNPVDTNLLFSHERVFLNVCF